MSADVLSDVLRAVRLTRAAYFDLELSAPWMFVAPPSRDVLDAVLPGVDHAIECHLVARGACWAHASGDTPRRLREGDLIVFPHGGAHVVSSAPGMHETSGMEARASTPVPMFYELAGADSDRTRIVCGFLGCDERPFTPLLSALPNVIHLSSTSDGVAAGWIATLMKAAAKESRSTRAGGDNVLTRVSELIVVEAIRRFVETLAPARAGWLHGARDPIVGQALAALHRTPHDRWTVERLARYVGVSRSVLAERFTQAAGLPPMHYLAQWRMQLASRLLLDGAHIAAVAAAVGYESEAAFSRAFKKRVGQSPAMWRKNLQGHQTRSTDAA